MSLSPSAIDPQHYTWAMSDTNKVVVGVTTSLSFLGCIIIFTTYLLFKDIQTTSRHIIICISIADFITCSANIYGLSKRQLNVTMVDANCQVQSFVGSSFVLASYLWTVALAIFLYITVVKENKDFADRLVWPWCHLICWLVPLLINVIAINLKVLGNSGDITSSGWCWIELRIDGGPKPIIWMLIDGKGIELLSYIIIIVLYILIKRKLRSTIRHYKRYDSTSEFTCQRTLDAAKDADKKLLFVPICFLLLRIWGTIRFILFSVHESSSKAKDYHKVLLYLQSVGDNFQGFVNCILFCFFTTKVRNHMKGLLLQCQKKFSSFCARCSSREDDDNENTLEQCLLPPTINNSIDMN